MVKVVMVESMVEVQAAILTDLEKVLVVLM